MEREKPTLVVTITAIAVAAILLVVFVWPGPGGLSFASDDRGLFDERLVGEVYSRVSPAVVEIYSDRKSGDSFIEVTSGSGFLIDKEGHIVSNNHVVQAAERVRISFSDHRNAEAVVQVRNPANDLVLLKVDPKLVLDIEPVELGDSSLVRPGQMVIIIGSPFGLKNSVSVGVSSGVDRSLSSELGRFIPGMLQTDALISPGSSGGPMLNSAGRVVGITTAIELSSDQVNQRIGFAVPINTLKELLPQLKEPGIVRPPWLGTLSQSLRPLLVERLSLPVERGFYVVRVASGSPAEEAGLVASGVDDEGRPAAGGDIIVAVDGVPVAAGAELTSQLNRRQPGDEITLTVVRDGTEIQLTVTLGDWPGQ
ncbi:MAG TPA: trypsin-like peptidase domain-containing protein [Dehalococcoidia bacterium]|jgi:S1-C subfamily serine protease|nr:trypsin-like peptidase domain-containing protein [Dehalococcoidia bacterium]